MEKKKVIDRSPIPLWFEDIEFLSLMEEIITETKVEVPSCYMLYQFALNTVRTEGNIAEVGVYKGGSAKLLATVFEKSGKELHLFDTFEGMPSVNQNIDWFSKGSFADTEIHVVRVYLSNFSNVQFHKGFFPDTTKGFEEEMFSFVHIDVDIHQSVKDCCEFFYPRLSRGGIMIFDDYGYRKCPGARIAVDEYFKDKECTPIYLHTGQCLVIKY